MRILPVTLIILTIFNLHRCKVITLKHFLKQPKYFFSSRIIAHNNDLFAFSGKIELEEGSLILAWPSASSSHTQLCGKERLHSPRKMSVGGAAAAEISSTSTDALLSGYLQKKTRDGRWQKRFFETSGVYLTYYKSKKMEKLLAALSLPQVAGIHVVDMDNITENPERLDGLFALELSSRVYILRAKSNEEASLWVKTLLKLRQHGATTGTSFSIFQSP